MSACDTGIRVSFRGRPRGLAEGSWLDFFETADLLLGALLGRSFPMPNMANGGASGALLLR